MSGLDGKGREVVLAIDPGDPHCGLARFVDGECVAAAEFKPERMLGLLELWFTESKIDKVVCEEWRLYGQFAATQSGSTMPTVEVIGVIRWLCRRWGVELIMQAALVKVPIQRILKAHGVKLQSWGHGDHAKDAELHGYRYLLKERWDTAGDA